MLRKIIAFSIEKRIYVLLSVLCLIVVGIYQTTKLPIDAVPDITNNQVQIITVAPSFSATDIERLVTFPVEQANTNISGIKEIRSFSRFGLSLVTIVFNDDIDIFWARQQVSERLQKIQSEIPTSIGVPELGPITTGLGEIYQYVIKPKKGYHDKYSLTDLRTIQDWIVRRQLLGVKGVAEVSSFGGKLKQYAIQVNQNKLQSLNVTLQDVISAIQKNNQNTGGAYIEKNNAVQYIKTEGLANSLTDLQNTIVKVNDGGLPLLVKDVGVVTESYATRYGALTYNDEGEVAGAIVMMLKGANSNEVIVAVKNRIAEIQNTLPEGVEIEPFLDRTKMVNNAIHTVEKNLIEGALIVILVLVIFLSNLRAGLIVASVIPLSMLFAIIMMNLFHVSGNLMSLGAIDFGLIVDGAVIIVEAVLHRLSRSISSQTSYQDVVKNTASKMMRSALFGQAIILIVYLPIFSLQGIEGKMFKPMAQTVAFALIGACILSLTYVPMMTAWLLKPKAHTTSSTSFFTKLEHKYKVFLNKALARPKTILSMAIIVFVCAIFILTKMGAEFIPTLEEGDFAVETRVLPGSSLSTTIEYTQKAAAILKASFPEVQKVVTKIGSGEVPTDPMPMDACDMMVILKDKKEWKSASSFAELSEKMSEKLRGLPGLATSFQYPVQMRFNELMTGAKQEVVCKIFGENLDSLSAYAEKLHQITQTIDGVKEIYVEPIDGLPQIVVQFNRQLMASYGVDIETANQTINAALAGQFVGKYFENEKRFDVVLRLDESKRQDIDDVKQIKINTQKGDQIALYQIANVNLVLSPNQIQREDAKRRIIVGFNTSKRDVQSIVQELQEKVSKQIKFTSGYYITYGGAFENLHAAKLRLSIAVPISLLLILFMLYIAFNSIKDALLIFTAIPLSAIGGILFLYARGLPFSISAGIGFIALFGVAVLNGIVLIAEFNAMRKMQEIDIKHIVVEAASVRLRPVIMTAMVASLGFLPMAISTGSGAEVQRPLATVVIGGLLVATLLTLFVLPISYCLVHSKKRELGINTKTLLMVIALSTISIFTSQAQTQQLTLNEAIQIGLKNNLNLKKNAKLLDANKHLVKSASMFQHTGASVEFGQFNSSYIDNRLSLSQNFTWPTVYKAQRDFFLQQIKTTELQNAWSAHELKKEITDYYRWIQIIHHKKILLDSLIALFEQANAIVMNRVNLGETASSEQWLIKQNLNQFSLQKADLIADFNLCQSHLQYLLQTHDTIVATDELQQALIPIIFDSAVIKKHPYLLWLQAEADLSKKNIQVEASKKNPDIVTSINSTTIKGIGADNKEYGGRDRFLSFQLGLSMPLFNSTANAKVSYARKMQEAQELEKLKQERYLQYRLKEKYANYIHQKKIVDSLGVKIAELAGQIHSDAMSKLKIGTINLLEWSYLMQQSIQTKVEYLDALRKCVFTLNELNYLILTE